MKRKNNPAKTNFEIHELTDFLSNAIFNSSTTDKFLDEMYKKYRFNRYVRLKIKKTFDILKIKYSKHVFFSEFITQETKKISLKFLIYNLKFNETLTIEQKLKYKKLLLDIIIKKSEKNGLKTVLLNIMENLKLSVSDLQNMILYRDFKKKLNDPSIQNKLFQVLKQIQKTKKADLYNLTEDELKQKEYIIGKNSILNLMNYQVEPFIESSQKALESFKYGKNQRKIILINSK